MADTKKVVTKEEVVKDSSPLAGIKKLFNRVQAGMQSHEVQDIKSDLALEIHRLEEELKK